jgi:hypothetical protein
MSGPGDRTPGLTGFGSSELAEMDLSPEEVTADVAFGRELERVGRDEPSPSAEFVDRVMGAIALEPDPRPVAATVGAARTLRPRAIAAAIAGAWTAAVGPGRPTAIRAQAVALLLVIALAVGTAGTAVVAGGMTLLGPSETSMPTPQVSPSLPTPEPTPSPEPSNASPSPSPSPSPSEGVDASEEPSDGAGATDGGSATSTPTPTRNPTRTATPTPTGTHHEGTPKPTGTPEPTDTPKPTGSDDH